MNNDPIPYIEWSYDEDEQWDSQTSRSREPKMKDKATTNEENAQQSLSNADGKKIAKDSMESKAP
eukprot:CAMPEP_0178393834 /NCGR_PEP_ID=MMETSP0689_2-20121128/12389_1 /TAXON_ID=160604 /ORGANISM="Amphidinium massartii, Strain CS-259" /LENGTH=64 /DNA_ID=CAMNT_0020014433 /DNA_START=558 /DNA_END=753 /DNA_ORIENTATION=+